MIIYFRKTENHPIGRHLNSHQKVFSPQNFCFDFHRTMADNITLQSAGDAEEAQEFTVAREIAELSVRLRLMLAEENCPLVLPVAGVSADSLERILEYCRHHYENNSFGVETDDISDFDETFCDVAQPVLFAVMTAANYLEIQPLVSLTCKVVANMIRGKTPQQIRDTFGFLDVSRH